jgi:uncharacterized membrane protein
MAVKEPLGNLTITVDRLKRSLFFVPMLFVVGAVLLAIVSLRVDEQLTIEQREFPLELAATVDSAREVLSTIAAATITVAGIAFSIALLIFQMASSQYSPRVIHGLFRDGFNKRVMGFVVGTFTFCLIVLRAVRSEVEDNGSAVIPTLSVTIATVLGIASILAVVAFINHNAHMMDVSEILQDVTDNTKSQIRNAWPEHGSDPARMVDPDQPGLARGIGYRINFDGDGWVQRVDHESLFDVLIPGGTLRLETSAGRYAVEGTAICTVWPPPEDEEAAATRARRAVRIGDTRTLNQDVGYGLRQLVDVALKALSAGVNDPTTAQDAVFHLAAVLREMLVRDPPPRIRTDDRARTIIASEATTHQEILDLAFDELRQAAGPHPVVCVYLLEAIRLIHDSLEPRGLDSQTEALRRKARLVVAECESSDVLDVDIEQVREAYRARFGSS